MFSPHWLQPTDWLLPDMVNAITAVLNSPTSLLLLQCTGWRYERIFALVATQPAQMLATFGLLFVPCYWSDWSGANPDFLCAMELTLAFPMFGRCIYVRGGSYKYTKKGEGSEWSMGNLYLYLQGYYMYLHVSCHRS